MRCVLLLDSGELTEPSLVRLWPQTWDSYQWPAPGSQASLRCQGHRRGKKNNGTQVEYSMNTLDHRSYIWINYMVYTGGYWWNTRWWPRRPDSSVLSRIGFASRRWNIAEIERVSDTGHGSTYLLTMAPHHGAINTVKDIHYFNISCNSSIIHSHPCISCGRSREQSYWELHFNHFLNLIVHKMYVKINTNSKC